MTLETDKLTIVCLDPGRVALVYVAVSTVEFYYCREKTTIGINVSHLHRMMRSMNNGDLLEWIILASDPHRMHICIVNSDKRTQTKNSLKLLVLDEETIDVPSVEFDRVVSLPSSDMSRYVRELAALSNIITVRGSSTTLELIAEGDAGSSRIIIEPTASGLNWLHSDPQGPIVEGRFFSKYMERFIRSQLDSSVELFLKNEYPLILRFEISIGTVRFCIAPTTEPE
jgi:proliferating cell nuclear antigen